MHPLKELQALLATGTSRRNPEGTVVRVEAGQVVVATRQGAIVAARATGDATNYGPGDRVRLTVDGVILGRLRTLTGNRYIV